MDGLKDRYIRFDWAIKRLLRQKANFDVLEGFLTVFLNEKFVIQNVSEGINIQLMTGDHLNRIAISAYDSNGEVVLIEIQATHELHYFECLRFGMSPMNTCINYSERFAKVYFINLLYFQLGQHQDYSYEGLIPWVGIHKKDNLLLRENQEKCLLMLGESMHICSKYYIVFVRDFNETPVTALEEWMRYLKDGVIRHDTTAPGLGKIREKLQYYAMDVKERRAYDEYLNAIMIQNDVLEAAKLEGYIKGHAEGLAEGRAEERLCNARKFKALGVPTDLIAKATGLSQEEIEKL